MKELFLWPIAACGGYDGLCHSYCRRRGPPAREAKVFAFVTRGMSNKEIAWASNCAGKTVKLHMTNIMQKLSVRNRVEVVRKFQDKDTIK